jgi:single-stranded DNA-specific DHH superfamily exonuclease
MLTEKQISDIRDHLERAQNPIFYYDNDTDGLCSFVILRKFIDRGKGVAVRSFPDLNASYARKAQELNADYVFVLDKPVLSKEFVEEIDKVGLPIVWIDHHDVKREDYEKEAKNLFIYNPARSDEKKGEVPTTYLAYQISGKKEDLWLGVVGCIADHYLPDFASEFGKKYPEFWGDVKKPFDAYFGTEIGKIAMSLNFGLKDSITNVVRLQNFLISCQGPGSVFEEVPQNYAFRRKYHEVKKKYDVLVEKAKVSIKSKSLFFVYSGDLSISSDIANRLSYLYPKKYVVVAYKTGAVANLSLRGKNVKQIFERALKDVEGQGGGHEDAVGARINLNDLEKFKEAFEDELKNRKG